ncbi:hypothetical protein KKH27_00025 [bacterium]|nr:hypothetical protein [bacterium]MBU1984810.1 hypothetical protein [bacterium]
MELQYIIYCSVFVAAIVVCWDLGPIFYVPMILDLVFDLALWFNLLAGWDIRLTVVTYGFLFFAWVLILSKDYTKLAALLIIPVDLAFVYQGVLPELQAAGTGQEFWNVTSTEILKLWDLSTFLLVMTVIVRSTIGAKLQGRMVDVLTNPRKRFLIPIGVWTGINLLHEIFPSYLPPWFVENGYRIASHALAWGWLALELPFFLAHRRLRLRHD